MVKAAFTSLTGFVFGWSGFLLCLLPPQTICFFCFFSISSSVNKCKFNDTRQMEESDKLTAADHQTQGCNMSYHCSDYWAMTARQLTSSPNPLYVLHSWYWMQHLAVTHYVCAIRTLLVFDWEFSLSGLKEAILSDFWDFKCFRVSCLTCEFDGMSSYEVK